MPTTVVRYLTKPDRADENQALIEAVFDELHDRQPDGVRYTSLRLDDGTFIHIADFDDGTDSASLTSLPAFTRFTDALGDRTAEPPTNSAAHRVGSYGHHRDEER